MYSEVFSVAVLLLVCFVGLTVLDLAVAGVLALVAGLSFKRCFLWGLLSLAVPVLLMVYGLLIERNCYRVNRVELEFDSLPEAFDGYKLVHLSDIHSRSFRYRASSLQRAVDKVNSLDADMIVFTGDLVTIEPSELDVTEPVLKGLKARDGVVSGIQGGSYAEAVKKQRVYYRDMSRTLYPYVISSAPTLIDDFNPLGETFCDYTISSSQVDKLDGENLERHQRVRHPRTAVAITENNHLILIVVDGRQTNRSGFSARELTRFLVKWFNPQYALSLDGGGSTAMCVEGQGDSRSIVNSPIQDGVPGKERARDTHIVIVAK